MKEKPEIYGDWNTAEAQLVNIYYEKCNNDTIVPKNTCHSDEEITQWLVRKFIIVLQNQERFQSHEYGEDRIVKEAKFKWFSINSSDRYEILQKIQISKLELQDKRPLQMGQLTEEESLIFGIQQQMNRPYEFPDDVHVVISYEFNLDMTVIARNTYTSLDWLGDVGGLA